MLVIREEQMQALSKDKNAPKTASDEQDKSICEGKESQDDFYKLPIKKGKLCHWELKNSANPIIGCSSDNSEKKLKLTVKAYIDLSGEAIEGVQFAFIDDKTKSDSLYSFSQTYLYDDESDDEFKANCKKTDTKGEIKDIELKPGDYTLNAIHIITIEKKDGSYKRVDEPSDKLPLDKNYILMKILPDIKECRFILYYKKLGCIIDSHMHIMSAHCSTAPMTDKMFYDKIKAKIGVGFRKKQGGLGLSGAADIGIGKQCTGDIAKKALEDNFKTYEHFKKEFPLNYENCELFTPMVVLTVDFEYAHIKGYEGKTIYRQKKNAVEPKKCEDIYNDIYYQNYYGEDPEAKVFFCNFKGELTELEDDAKQHIKEGESLNKGFEPWQKQLKQTVKVVIENPWKLIPFFFYEPRRWLKDKEWGKKKGVLKPFDEVATQSQSGLFVGFKMYTPYGFKPSDPKLPGIDDFYKYCADNQIPIMTHCTPGGSYTHERELYLEREDKEVAEKCKYEITQIEGKIKELKQKKQKIKKVFIEEKDKERIEQLNLEITMLEEEIQNVKIKYFNDNFVSPSAWNEVLNNHKNLKLCLAHFGGKTAWAYIISDLCSKYPNVYTDVSDMLHTREYRNIIEHVLLSKAISKAKNDKLILYKVIFGTDWYVMKSGFLPDFQFDYYRYCLRSKRFLDELTKKFQEAKVPILTKEEDLWTLFTIVNPFRYLGFVDENAEVNTKLINNIALAFKKKVGVNKKDELKKNTDIIMKTAQSVSKYLKSDEERLKLVKW